jgi:hypothetical protein
MLKFLNKQPRKHPRSTIENSQGYLNIPKYLSMVFYSPIAETLLPSHARDASVGGTECFRNGCCLILGRV